MKLGWENLKSWSGKIAELVWWFGGWLSGLVGWFGDVGLVMLVWWFVEVGLVGWFGEVGLVVW